MDKALPKGWKWVKLGEVADVLNGSAFPKKFQGRNSLKYPFFKVSDMNLDGNEVAMAKANNYVNDEMVGAMKGKVHASEMVIFPKIGGAIATNKKRKAFGPLLFDNNVMGIAPKESLDLRFLFYYLLGFDLKKWASKSALPSIRKSKVADHRVPLPPPSEQKRIVAKLDALFEKIDRGVEMLNDTLNLLEDFYRSVLNEELGHGKGLGEKWPMKILKDVARIGAIRGYQPDLIDGSKVPFVGMKDVDEVSGFNTNYELRDYKKVKSSYTKFMSKAVLLAKITPCTQNNKTSLAPNVEGGFATTEVYPIHSGVDLEPIFLLYFLRSPKVRNVLKKSMVGATGRQRVPTEAVEFLEIPLPSMSEQKRIVAKLDALSAGKDKMMYTLNNRLDYLKRLKYSILYSAFNGQL